MGKRSIASQLTAHVPAPQKTKVAVLGAGIAAIAAVYELTQQEKNRNKYEITIYQPGWRIGGKCASGRNQANGDRIEEHGLHLWFGFYENAFKIMKDAYKTLDRSPLSPLATFDDAFKGQDLVVLMDQYKGEWRTPWKYDFPVNKGVPGQGGEFPSLLTMAWLTLDWLLLNAETFFLNMLKPCQQYKAANFTQPRSKVAEGLTHLIEIAETTFMDIDENVHAEKLLNLAAKALKTLVDKADKLADSILPGILNTIADALEKYRSHMWQKYGCHVDNDTARQYLTLTDTALTWIIGAIRDNVLENGIFSLDKYDLNEWMLKNGCNPLSIEAPPARALYDNIFGYENGDVNKPNCAAGTSLLWAGRMVFTYRGHIMWRMQASMGDVVFTPFHQVLESRGVKFKFFHCVQNLGLSSDKKSIDTIQVMQQAELNVDQYNPYIMVKNLPCWPSEPNWEQLKDGEKLKKAGVNFEKTCAVNPKQKPITLKKGTDFDIVILGIPVAATAEITPELYKDTNNPKWKQMIDNIKTVQTQGFQMWMNKDLEQLGWIYGDNSAVTGTYTELLDTYADMSELIPHENWLAKFGTANIAYYCGAMPDFPTQEESDAYVKKSAKEMVVNGMPPLWKNLKDKNGNIHWEWLVDQQERKGEARFDGQFFRANWTKTERYTLSVKGSTQYRLKTNQSGYSNLFLVGDWIDNNFNSGCVEASVMSGMQASQAICGYPRHIVGDDHQAWIAGKLLSKVPVVK